MKCEIGAAFMGLKKKELCIIVKVYLFSTFWLYKIGFGLVLGFFIKQRLIKFTWQLCSKVKMK